LFSLGYDGTTTRDLAQAGVAEGTIFRYFANKKVILVEVATRCIQNCGADIFGNVCDRWALAITLQAMHEMAAGLADIFLVDTTQQLYCDF
jgi:AcrR family transcriptional regulator